MPRKKQAVQKQKRRKAYGGQLAIDPTHTKPRGAFRVFSNYRLFAIIGVAVLASGLLLSAYYANKSTTRNTNGSVRGDPVVRTTPEANSTAEATGAQATIKQYTEAPAMAIDVNKTYSATIKTDDGDIKVQLLPKEAPEAVNNFVFLAKDGFYNGVTFYRVVADETGAIHFAQAGDPTGTGYGGPGYDIPAEKTATQFDTPGILAMAKPAEAGAPNNGSQFFFTLQSEPTLDGKFTAFGKIADEQSLAVLSKLPPRDPLSGTDTQPGARIQSVTIEES